MHWGGDVPVPGRGAGWGPRRPRRGEEVSVGPRCVPGAGGARGAGAAGPASSCRRGAGRWEVPRAAVEAGVRADPGSLSAAGSPGGLVQVTRSGGPSASSWVMG